MQIRDSKKIEEKIEEKPHIEPLYEAYNMEDIAERHRHRFEFNNDYKKDLEDKGLVISGVSPDDFLVEIVELPNHPWAVGCQFHPEFKSRPNHAHPLFRGFVKAADDYAKLKKSRQAKNQE